MCWHLLLHLLGIVEVILFFFAFLLHLLGKQMPENTKKLRHVQQVAPSAVKVVTLRVCHSPLRLCSFDHEYPLRQWPHKT